MKRRVPNVALPLAFLVFIGAVGVIWYRSQNRIPQEGEPVAPSSVNRRIHEPIPTDQVAAVEEVVPILKRQPPEDAEDYFKYLPPVDLDKFGDITPNLYLVRYETFMRLFNAQEVAKSPREVTKIAQELHRESQEYMRQHFPEAYRLLSEKKPEWAEKLVEEQTRKEGDRQGLATAVMLARHALAIRGDFRLGGIVVDEDARPLSGVSVKVSKETIVLSPKGWPRGERATGAVDVTGSFLLRIADARRIQLGFHKPGYYEVRSVEFALPELTGARYWEVGLTGKKLPPQQIERRDLRIVMERQGKLTRLTPGGGTLEFRHDGTGDVVEMGLNAGGHWFMQGTRRTDMSIRPPKHLPEKCLYIVPKTDEKGRIVLMKLSALQSRRAKEANRGGPKLVGSVPDDETQYVYAPTEVRLVVSDPQGGFIRYEPKPDREIRPDRPWTRDMKEAPQEGYIHELVLDSEAIKKLFANPDEPQPVYFYIEAFGKYGKGQLDLRIILRESPRKYVNGQLEPIRYLLDEAGVAAQVQVLVQPDGSRNLEGYE